MPPDSYRGSERRNGPSLGEYLETRLKLLDEHLAEAMEAMDLRYQQRFEAQQSANQTALVAVEKALQAALVATALANSKAEVEANQRSGGVVSRIDDVGKRIDTLASRFDTLAGQLAGGGSAGKSFEARIALAFSSIAVLVLLWRVMTGH